VNGLLAASRAGKGGTGRCAQHPEKEIGLEKRKRNSVLQKKDYPVPRKKSGKEIRELGVREIRE